MRKIISLLFVSLFFTSIFAANPKQTTTSSSNQVDIVDSLGNLANNLVGTISGRPVFAFLPLKSDDENALVENYVTDALMEAVFSTGKIKITEQERLENVLSELKFQNSGLVNEKTAKRIGQLSGASYVCFGAVKDLGNKISINVRVINVESGEIAAMSRDTINKDKYLANIGFEKRMDNNTASSGKSGTTPKAAAKVNSFWQVRSTRNDFDGYTTYTFTLKGSGKPFLFVGYDKYDNPMKSVVRAGVNWVESYDTDGTYDFKGDDGNVITKKFTTGYTYWSYVTGWKSTGKEKFAITYTKGESANFCLDLFEKNKFLTVRHLGETFRFQTEGLWQVIEAQGITRDEIENAIANEEF